VNVRTRIAAWWRRHEPNPVLVKETRQAVRSSQFLTVLGGLVSALAAASLIFLVAQAGEKPDVEAGSGYLVLISVMLSLALLGAAGSLFWRSHREREPGNADLLFITTLSPGAIVRGKFLAGVGTCSLILSLGLPFLTCAYLLRGVDLVTLFGTVAGLFAGGLILSLWAIFCAAYSGSKVMRHLLFVAPIFLLQVLPGVAFGIAAARRARGGSAAAAAGSPVLPAVLAYGLALFSVLAVLYALSVFLLAPPNQNRALPCRALLSGLLLLWLGTGLAVMSWTGDRDWYVMALAAAVPLILTGLVTGLLTGDPLSRRVQGEVPRRPLLRLPALFLFNGSLPALLWTAAAMGAVALWHVAVRAVLAPHVAAGVAAPDLMPLRAWLLTGAYLLFYALLARSLAALLRRHTAAGPGALACGLLLALPAIGMVLSWVAKATLRPLHEFPQDTFPLPGNLFACFQENQHALFWRHHALFVAVAGGVLLALNLRWLRATLAQFRAPAAAGTDAPAPPVMPDTRHPSA
jgi:hypothetical protein